MTALLTAPLTTVASAAPVVVPRTTPMLAGAADVQLYRLSVEQYHDAVRHGILSKEDPVELLDGLLVQKMPEDPAHAALIDLASTALRVVLPVGWTVRPDHPITTDASEAEPDVVVARGNPRDYMQRHPGPQDCALAIEIANSSVARDRGFKREPYARAGMPVYWIVVLPERIVEVYADPSGPTAEPAYGTVRRFADGESVPVVIDGREVGTVPVADLLPWALPSQYSSASRYAWPWARHRWRSPAQMRGTPGWPSRHGRRRTRRLGSSGPCCSR